MMLRPFNRRFSSKDNCQFQYSTPVNLVILLLTLVQVTTVLSSSSSSSAKPVFRKNHLDYLNAETLSYYLGTSPLAPGRPLLDYDVVVLYYADWDRNSHTLAPMWAKIAKFLRAGSYESKLILGLFDCEINNDTMRVCRQAGITHYPTLQYLSFSGQTFQRPHPRHATTFGGNWQYGDAILDWIKVLRGLSQWHRAGWGKRLRQLFSSKKVVQPELPIGLDTIPAKTSGSPTLLSSAETTSTVSKLEREKRKLQELQVRGSVMIEAMLFPLHRSTDDPRTLVSEGGKNYTDVFTWMSLDDSYQASAQPSDTVKRNSTGSSTGRKWTLPEDELTDDILITRTCVQDMSLDYCERTTTRVLEDMLLSSSSALDDWPSLQKSAHRLLQQQEPYCLLLEDCLVDNYRNESCRPLHCPFVDKVACRYLTSCLFKTMRDDYAEALGIMTNKSSTKPTASATTTTTSQSSPDKKATKKTDASKETKGFAFGL